MLKLVPYKFTGENGHVSLSIRRLSMDGEKMVVQILVKDDGCGMSKGFLSVIFTPFSQEKNANSASVQGTGLGLALAREVARLLGGDITVESELGKGSTFTITSVREYRKNVSTPLPQKPASSHVLSSLAGLSILLAEDHPLNAMICERLLSKEGAIVKTVRDGREALEEFSISPLHGYDVILMDIRMPVMDGCEATRAIRSLTRKDASVIPIIALTANAFEEDREASKRAGMDAHLSKPIEPKLLCEMILKCVAEKQDGK
jgi:CheY-like chemotaxis protein